MRSPFALSGSPPLLRDLDSVPGGRLSRAWVQDGWQTMNLFEYVCVRKAQTPDIGRPPTPPPLSLFSSP
ncbi:hypothetical protein RHS01_02240 [Rhizoctonia solani]|uniref:Uncharacterized protein n=1 Tax=Rhizoctonia solani TaxID=456999 RepID=A0A8H7M853_9AGAM|nr:hypothetical protein RHS01_02240 [Rhizoctonia solani]